MFTRSLPTTISNGLPSCSGSVLPLMLISRRGNVAAVVGVTVMAFAVGVIVVALSVVAGAG